MMAVKLIKQHGIGRIAALFAGAVMVCGSAASAATLKLQYGFEDSGTTTTDSVAGSTLNLTSSAGVATDYHGATGTGVAGSGKALNFTSGTSGSSGPLASTVNDASVNFGTSLNTFSITEWLKPTVSANQASKYPRYFIFGPNGATDTISPSTMAALPNANASPDTQVFVSGVQQNIGPLSLTTNQWNFFGLTWDGTNLKIYKGTESTAATLVGTYQPAAGSIDLGSSFSLFLGNRSTYDRSFQGYIDDFRVYSGSDANMEAIRASAVPEPGTLSALAVGALPLLLRRRSRSRR